MNFKRAFIDLIDIEKGFTIDRGGPTMYGITERVARAHGYTGEMKNLPLSFAELIYQEVYWHPLYDKLPYAVAYQLFDAAVNSGTISSAKWLQQVLGVTVDGKIGPKTTVAALAYDPLKLIISFNAIRLQFMTGLINWPEAGRGWARRIAKNLKKGVELNVI